MRAKNQKPVPMILAGEKLRVIYQTAVPNITVAIGSSKELASSEIQYTDSTDYLLGGALTLKNGRIDKFQFEEGYCLAEKYNTTQDYFTFCFYDQDHLGNIRQVTKADGYTKGKIIQKMHYYPFGAQLCDGTTDSNVQSHKYNGKEYDRMHGLNTYDYGARQYNPVTARWDRVDPLAEKYYNISPYAYCMNNPVKYVDPDGKEIWIHYVDGKNNLQSFQYSAGMTCTVDNPSAKSIVSNLNIMHSNRYGAIVLDAIIESKTKYGFRQANTHSENGEGYFDPSTNSVSLNDANNTMAFAEETFHIYQRVNGQGGASDVNEVEAKLFSSKMNYEINPWRNGAYANNLAGLPESSYTDNMNNLFWGGFNEKDYESAVNNFFSGSFSGRIYKKLPGYHHGVIKRDPLIKNFLPVE